MESPARPLRCAAFARDIGLDPIGSAGSYEGYWCVQWPRPWPARLEDEPALAELANEADRRRARLQAIGGAPGTEGDATTVVVYRRPPGDFTGYERREALSGRDHVTETAVGLWDSGTAAAGGDVLVCTHGRRDACCGSLGTRLALELEADGATLGGRRLWRSSHLGGHRFAPTVLVLPEGTLWAYMDPERIRQVTERRGSLERLLPCYRGCTGLDSPELQALEREAFGILGWDLLGCSRSGTDIGAGAVSLTVTAPDGRRSVWEAQITTRATHSAPDCGRPLGEAVSRYKEFSVDDLRGDVSRWSTDRR